MRKFECWLHNLKSIYYILNMKNWLLSILAIIILLTQCSKEKINVSIIYPTDNLGNLIGSTPNDNQWKNVNFSGSELALFSELDTANLSGTQLPTISNSSYGYPNPFASYISVHTSLTQPLNGEIVVKYVVVDNKMKSVEKGSTRIYITSSINFMVSSNFSSGKYRLYFTYSAEGHKHFFKSWGNIQKM